jgi:hypothetical protein
LPRTRTPGPRTPQNYLLTIVQPFDSAIDTLEIKKKQEENQEKWNQLRAMLRSNWVLGLAGYGCVILGSFVILWLRPLWLLGINNYLRPLETNLPLGPITLKLPVRHILFVGFLNYSPRVLDAWVGIHAAAVRQRFQAKPTVEGRNNPIGYPVVFQGQTLPELSVAACRSGLLTSEVLLIWDEGGAGKTTLACQVARWAIASEATRCLAQHVMLPILIEHEFAVTEGPTKFALAWILPRSIWLTSISSRNTGTGQPSGRVFSN